MHEIFRSSDFCILHFFLKLGVRRGYTTSFSKNEFDFAELFEFKGFPRRLSIRGNWFPVCSACDEIRSPYAQPAMKLVPRMLSMFEMNVGDWVGISPHAEHTRKLVPRMLSIR